MKRNKGFTLMEMLIVIAIIAVLAAIFLPIFAKSREKAARAVDLANARSIQSLLAMLVMDGEIDFPPQTQNTQNNGVWVVICRDANSYPDSYGRQNGTIFCGTDTAVTVNGTPSPGWNQSNPALQDLILRSLGGDALRVHSKSSAKIDGIGGWDWYLVQYSYNTATKNYDSRIYSGLRGEKSAFNAKPVGTTNMEQYLNR